MGTLAVATAATGCGGGATVGGTPLGSPTTSPVTGTSAPPTTPGATATPTGAPGATATPTAAPGATATPSPGAAGATATPTAAAAGAVYHPDANGDTFTMNGTLLVTYDRSNQYPSPEPTSSTLYSVSQAVTVTNPVAFNGASNAVDFAYTETDTQVSNAQTFQTAVDNYFQLTNTIYSGNFLSLGYKSVDDPNSSSSHYTVTQTNGTNDQLADVLPETAGATWSNMAGRTVSTNDGNGNTSSMSYADTGAYTGTTTYQNFQPSPNPTGSQLTNQATLTANIDGSATYNTPRLGTDRAYNYVYQFDAPTAAGAAGTITETTTIPPAAAATPGATGATPGPTATSTSVANWMPATVPGSLASESDVDNGAVALPSACAVPSNYGTTTNQIVQKKLRVDPIAGELENTTTTTYDMANVGPVCVVIHDVQQNYYDFSGQNGATYFSSVPLQTSTIDETLYLSVESLKSVARRASMSAGARAGIALNVSLAQSRVAALRSISHARAIQSNALGRATLARAYRGALL